MIHYAIGDIHGCDDQLESLHRQIEAYHRRWHESAPATVIHVGDYVDRGPHSARVLDRLRRGLDGLESICLRGNHEAMLLACLAPDDPQVWAHWHQNGASKTLASLGIDSDERDSLRLAQALGEDRIAWLRALPLYHRAGNFLFVHAGIAPGVPLQEQRERDLLWIRTPFLDSDADHGFFVVHGHTPSEEPDLRQNRLNIDTGAVFGGKLTAAVLAGSDAPHFLFADAEED